MAGGWGVVSILGTNQFLISCKIIVGNSTTASYFGDTNKQVTFASGIVSANNQYFIYMVNSGTTITFGTLISSSKKTTHSGCSFLSLEASYRTYFIQSAYAQGHLYCYSCTFTATTQRHTFGVSHYQTFYNCIFGKLTYLANAQLMDAYNLVIENVVGGVGCANTYGTMSRITITDCQQGLYSGAGLTQTYRDFTLQNNTYALSNYPAGSYDIIFVDCDIDEWTFNFYAGWTGEAYRRYSFDLAVANTTNMLENANVTLTKNGIVEYSGLTNSTGQITTQTLTYGYYNITGGNSIYDTTPYTLEIFDPSGINGNYTSTFYPLSKIDWAITIQEPEITEEQQEQNIIVAVIIALVVGCSVAVVVALMLTTRKR